MSIPGSWIDKSSHAQGWWVFFPLMSALLCQQWQWKSHLGTERREVTEIPLNYGCPERPHVVADTRVSSVSSIPSLSPHTVMGGIYYERSEWRVFHSGHQDEIAWLSMLFTVVLLLFNDPKLLPLISEINLWNIVKLPLRSLSASAGGWWLEKV